MVAPMMAAAGIGMAGSLLSGLMGSRAAKKARSEQAAANARQQQLIQESNDKANNLLIPAANYNPALSKLMALNGLSGGQAQQDAYGAFQQGPDYQFNLSQGEGAINRSAAANGTALSGRTLMDSMKFNQGLASQEYGNYYNRLNNLYGSQLGAAGDLAQGYRQGGSQLAGLAGQLGQIGADATMAKANSWQNAIQGVANSASYGLGGLDGNWQQAPRPNPTSSSYVTSLYN
jgi:hypothetical protein